MTDVVMFLRHFPDGFPASDRYSLGDDTSALKPFHTLFGSILKPFHAFNIPEKLSQLRFPKWADPCFSALGSVLVSLSEDDLKSLGVNKLGDRKRLLKEIARLQGRQLTSSSSKGGSVRKDDDLAASGSLFLLMLYAPQRTYRFFCFMKLLEVRTCRIREVPPLQPVRRSPMASRPK
jgi:hypothetical protein